MKVAILGTGTRGEVQPLVALGVGLRAAGHSVRMGTHADFEGLVRGYGLEFAPVWGGPDEVLETEPGRRLLASGPNFVKAMRALRDVIRLVGRRPFDDSWAACEGADSIIYGQLALGGPHIAEKKGIPSVAAFLNPITPTAEFPVPSAPMLRLGGWYNRLTLYAARYGFAATFYGTLNGWRRERLGLPKVSLGNIIPRCVPIAYGFSPTLIPTPRDWPAWVRVTGHWFLDAPPGWTPPAGLDAFVSENPKPIYIGFGSMRDRDTENITEVVANGLKLAGQRAVVLTGKGAVRREALPDAAFAVESVPFEWLLPRVAAVVHHGGLGTCHSALRAGAPQVIVPFMGDQPFWAARVAALGVSTPPIPRRRLTAEALAEAIRRAPTLRDRAAEVGKTVQSERGIENALRFIRAMLR